jgi:hypothetical protein
MYKLFAIVLTCLLAARSFGQLGERPAITRHVDQSAIDAGELSLADLNDLGLMLFDARFNRLDGQGRPATTGGGAPREPDEPAFIRTSAPDSTACSGCHAQPRSGGAGGFATNVFVLAQTLDPVTDSVDGAFSNERNTLGMMGAGPIEMLAREMTAELIAIRETAVADAADTGMTVTRPLVAKNVSFGTITVLPDGRIDPSGIDGVDWDLIVKPFHQKGAVVSIREFTNNAMNHHHGMQSVERFGLDTDPDQDGVVNELTIGDMTAVTIFQAALNTPGRVIPHEFMAEVSEGEQLFGDIGCTECHIPALTLDDPVFTEPNPFNPDGNLTPDDLSTTFAFDLTADGPTPRLERTENGGAVVRTFTDLKRHNLTDDELDFFGNEQIPQGKLNGFAPASDFTIEPPPRPTHEFLTRKLWDAGNTDPYGHRGDLTTMTDAIFYHGGDARASRDAFFALPRTDQDRMIEFLRTLQIVPNGSERVTITGIPSETRLCGAVGMLPLLVTFGVMSLMRVTWRKGVGGP